jgi:hypothetical protein
MSEQVPEKNNAPGLPISEPCPAMQGRFHWSYALRFLRKTLIVYLLPLVQVVFDRAWSALLVALYQDFALLCVAALLCTVFLFSSRWWLDADGTLHLHWDLVWQVDRTLRSADLAAVQLDRTLFQHITGAAKLTLYPACPDRKANFTLYLPASSAKRLAERLIPAEVSDQSEVYHPDGGEYLALAFLSANGLTTLLLLLVALRQQQLYGAAGPQLTAHLSNAAAWAAHWLPVGLAWLLTALAFLAGVSLGRSFLHTLRYRVWNVDGILCGRGGVLHTSRYRIRTAMISYADVRLTPAARLLHRCPVYVAAGAYADNEIPVYIYDPRDAKQTAALEAMLPGFQMPPRRRSDPAGRSIALLLPTVLPLVLFAFLTFVSAYVLPALTPVLLFPTLYFALMLFAAREAWYTENAFCVGGRLTLRRQQNFTIHCVCVLTPHVCLSLFQTPWAVAERRTDLSFYMPGRRHFNVRSIPLADAERCLKQLEAGQPRPGLRYDS